MTMISIPESFKNKNIFITGGSGFIGKVLIEKLLRSCPDLGNIYLLIRPKKGLNAEERIKQITDLPLFDRLKQEKHGNINKLKVIPGDVMELGLGLSEEDRTTLINNVNIIYHAAASVRFDDPICKAIILNTRGTREICNLALEVKNLDAFVHVSTTYCNTDRPVVEEVLYPPHANWREAIKLAEKLDEDTFNIFTMKYMNPLVNTYTFAKSLAEHVVNDLCKGTIPSIIFRPSIVISTAEEPMPGWIDNFNGPVGLLVASGKGVLRSLYTNPDIVPDYVPVDIAVKGLIVIVWNKLMSNDPSDKLDVTVYNGSSNRIHPITLKEMIDMGKSISVDMPLNGILWFPGGNITNCWYYHFIRVIFYHLLPAIIIDGLLKLSGNKPILFNIQKKIYTANMALEYFISREWSFPNVKMFSLQYKLLDCDKDTFAYREEEIVPVEYFKNSNYGCRKYLLKEDDSNFENAKTHMRRMYIISQIYNFFFYAILAWLIFVKIDIISILVQKYHDSIMYLTTE